MSLFPAYADDTVTPTVGDSKTPSWLTNTSFADFQGSLENQQTSIAISSDEADPLEAANVIIIKSDEDEVRERSGDGNKAKKSKRSKKRLSRGRSSETDSEREEKRKKKNTKRSRSRSRTRHKHKSRSRSRERRRDRSESYDRRRKRSRSKKKKDRKRDRRSQSRSRSGERRSRSTGRKEERTSEEMIARMNSKKVFIEEVGGSWKNAFREDRKGDKTNLSGSGFYARDVAKYKTRVRIPLGKDLKKHRQKVLEENPRFHQKLYIKQISKAKNVIRITKETSTRPPTALVQDFSREYLSLALKENIPQQPQTAGKSQTEGLNPLGIYSEATVDYMAGIGGLGEKDKDSAVFENSDIELRRIEFNTKLREKPHDVNLWLEFIDFQDEALRETVFESNDEKESKKMRKKNGEILRAKALTERKLAICRSAIEKNTRSIDLAVKRLELSRDLLDSKTLDQQWKELIFVYPENIALWKRYLLFIQTHYIRFSISDTIKAYKGCILKLKSQLEKFISSSEESGRVLEFEHGILDIIEAGALVWLQSGHTERAIAVYQALLEFNLFSPDFDVCGNYSVDDRLSLFEPLWDSGVRRVGQAGARGWGVELQERLGQQEDTDREEQVHNNSQQREDDLIANGAAGEKGNLWLQLETFRDQEFYFPWRNSEPEPEDPDRIVDFDTVHGFLVLFSSQESKLRILLSLLRMLGYEERSKTFSNLVDSEAVAKIFNTRSYISEDFTDESVLKKSLPTYKTKESLAIFAHYLFAQTYNRFREPFRTKIILMWLDFEREIINLNDSDKGMKKDLKKLVKSLLKEDRNNVELVAKFVEIEYQLEGYQTAHQIVETSFTAFDKKFLAQKDEDSIISSLTLYRTGVELELNEIMRRGSESDALHKDRLQWLLIQAAAETSFQPLTDGRKSSIIALVDSTQDKFIKWIDENIDKVTRIKFSKKAPNVKHSLIEVIFLYAWLSTFSLGWQEGTEILQKFSNTIREKLKPRKDSRFNEDFLTLKFLDESINKIMFDILWYESHQDIKVKQNLRTFYIQCLQQHSHNGYFLCHLASVEDSTSVVSTVWREVCQIVKDKDKVNHKLVEEILRLGLTKFVKVLDRDCPGQLPCVGLGFLNKLHNLLEFLVKLPTVRHSALVWRMMLWTTSILQSDAESLKTMLYRAIQDVAWCKALYVDTGIYLDKIGQLYCTTRRQLHNLSGDMEAEGEEEEEDVEPRYEEIPGTLEHITELLVEKDLRLRLPLQELDVLLEPVI